MTKEDAIKILHPQTTIEALSGISHIDAVDMVETASIMACEALEKQIPKKTIRGEYGHFECACCGWVWTPFAATLSNTRFAQIVDRL